MVAAICVRGEQRLSFLLTLLLLLNSGLGGSTTSSSGATGSGGSGTTSGSDVYEQILDVLALQSLCNRKKVSSAIEHVFWSRSRNFMTQFHRGGESSMLSGPYLGEDGSPDGLNLDLSGGDESLELVGLNCREKSMR